ncbi:MULTISPECIES: cation:proton antiporter [unclassified Lysobacter]|uniref:cation:proton antiporter domain-containing protein n=1 Tax=unclassified Lysobacter TaxID=2635362 RepID=UPI001C220C0E|nr:cation:proton antiporter [Lysobacter sp. MMG2]MBU8978048.1 cation:proton antiporter [Lysobacter sp. MMG2]
MRPKLTWWYLLLVIVPLAVAAVMTHYPFALPVAPSPADVAHATQAATAHGPLTSPLSRFLLQLLVVLGVAKSAGWLLRRFGQPAVIGEMAAGLLLGPLLFGAVAPDVQGWLFAPQSLGALGLVSQLGVLMFLFVAGAELDLTSLHGRRGFALLVSHAGIALPFLCGVLLAFALFAQHAPAGVGFASFALFMGVSLSITAFPVLLRILSDRGLTHTEIGRIAIACAALGDASAWCLLAVIVATVQATGWGMASVSLLGTLLFAVAVLALARPWITRRAVPVELEGRALIALLLLALACALVTEVLGIHALFGAFLAGVAVSGNARLRHLLVERVEPFAISLLLPLFFAMTGLRLRMDGWQASDVLLGLGVIVVATLGKGIGTWMSARSAGMPNVDAMRLGALMNTRGLMELIVLNLGYELGLIGDRLFAVLVVMALVTTAMTGPLLDLIERRARR